MSPTQKTLICRLKIIGSPKPKNKKRARWVDGKPKIYPDQSHVPWSVRVIDAVNKANMEGRRELGTFQVDCEWRLRRPDNHFRTIKGQKSNVLKDNAPVYVRTRPDRDNLDKANLDALTESGIWRDDSQAATGWLERRYCNVGEAPGCNIVIFRIED